MKRKEKVFKPRESKFANDTRTPTERLADQVTPLHKYVPTVIYIRYAKHLLTINKLDCHTTNN